MRKLTIGVVTVTALLALSCGEEEGITRPPPPSLNLPADVIDGVELSFNQKNIDLLKKCLSPDFIFHFDPDDVGRNPPGSQYVIPETWSYAEFRQATKNMFYQAYSVNLSIPTSGVGEPGENETTYKADNVRISLLVMVTELNGFLADKGYCNFAFERYETEKGEKYWRLTGWWDRTSGFLDGYPGANPTSLGRVLAMYR